MHLTTRYIGNVVIPCDLDTYRTNVYIRLAQFWILHECLKYQGSTVFFSFEFYIRLCLSITTSKIRIATCGMSITYTTEAEEYPIALILSLDQYFACGRMNTDPLAVLGADSKTRLVPMRGAAPNVERIDHCASTTLLPLPNAYASNTV